MKHYDFFGRELMVGDRVAYIDSKYQELRNGEILKLNEKQATIRNLDDDGLFGDKMGYQGVLKENAQEYEKVIQEYSDRG